MAEVFALDQTIAQVRAAATACGAYVVDAALALQSETVPVIGVDSTAFPDLIRHVKPRVVYVLASPFHAGNDTLLALDEDDESLLERPRVEKVVTKWRFRNGQTSRIALGLMCDGVLHGIVEDADWLAEFEDEVEALSDDIQSAREEQERKVEAADRRRQAPHVKKLMADPRFSAPKVGAAKRTALAELLFPELDRATIRAVVERAETDHWLATAGR